jgi:hypothetical protein
MILIHDSQLDEAVRLTSSITASTAGTAVLGTVANVDLGQQARQYAGAPGATDTSAASSFGRFRVLIDWSTIDVASGDERYDVELQGSNATGFGTVYRLGLLQLGHSSTTGNATSTPANGRRILYVDNVIFPDAASSAVYATTRYVRLRVTPAGTTPSITITGAWLLPA